MKHDKEILIDEMEEHLSQIKMMTPRNPFISVEYISGCLFDSIPRLLLPKNSFLFDMRIKETYMDATVILSFE